eukprot:SM000206S06291  [mRNA]  locus=s206:149785:150458:- [translate_table: standard]
MIANRRGSRGAPPAPPPPRAPGRLAPPPFPHAQVEPGHGPGSHPPGRRRVRRRHNVPAGEASREVYNNCLEVAPARLDRGAASLCRKQHHTLPAGMDDKLQSKQQATCSDATGHDGL